MRAWVYLNIQNPLVAWLVYRGEMVSADLLHASAVSVWHTERLRAMTAGRRGYETELAIEGRRSAAHPAQASRLKGFYAFPDRATAENAAAWGPAFNPAFLAEVEILGGATVSRYDSEWITHDFAVGPGPWIDLYLDGQPRSGAPLWELVIQGRAYVLGTDLRTWARNAVEATWPESLGLLELSRLAVEIDSDLGAITAMAFAAPDGVQIRYTLQFVDADDPAFLNRLANHPGPADTRALAQFRSGEMRMPDLTSFEFVVPRP